MKASFKGRIVACERQETEGGNALCVVTLDAGGKVAEVTTVKPEQGWTPPVDRKAHWRGQLALSPAVADRLVFGASVTIEVEIADREVSP